MTGRWILANRLPHLCTSDIVRDRRSYEGEHDDIMPWAPFTPDNPEFLEMWCIADISRNGWVTLERNTRHRRGIWTETGETRKVRGRKALSQMIVAVTPHDHRWEKEWAA